MPSPYEVSLVGPISSSQGAATEDISKQAGPAVRDIEHVKQPEKVAKDSKADLKRLDDQLSALKAKKKMHNIVDLRSKVASISGGQGKTSPKSAARGTANGSSQGSGTYADKIIGEIREKWGNYEWAEKDLLMIINVRILRDGTIQVLEVEKKSGNSLFDRSVQLALIKASPVTPPPAEMEIGMRFYP